jgi:hypothetical protein
MAAFIPHIEKVSESDYKHQLTTSTDKVSNPDYSNELSTSTEKVSKPDYSNELKTSTENNRYQVPVRIRWEDEPDKDLFTLPYDPVISIEGENNIVKRSVLKKGERERRRGTIKELWSQGDYKITISGWLIGEDGIMPEADLFRLRNYCEERKRIYIESDILDTFDIRYIIIESWSLPHTAGQNNQTYSISAISDDDYDLLIKR